MIKVLINIGKRFLKVLNFLFKKQKASKDDDDDDDDDPYGNKSFYYPLF